ncbi:hypothetical protein Tco_1059142, partial [Tanacetum coccineum]
SGATQHMTFSIDHLYDVIDVSHLKITVAHPNGTIEMGKHVGNYKISDKFILRDVLVVPGYKDSLLKFLVGTGSEINGILGHPSDQVLSVLKDKIQIDSLDNIQPWGLPLNMWPESVLTVVYLINKIPSAVLSGKSPYEMIYKIEPSLSHFKTFGNEYSIKGQKQGQKGQNRVRDWKEREKTSSTVPSDLIGSARDPLNGSD